MNRNSLFCLATLLLCLPWLPIIAQDLSDDFSDPAAPNWAFYCPAGSCVIENQELHAQANGSSGWGEDLAALFQPSSENYRISFDYKQRTWAGWLTIHFGRDGFPGAWDRHYYSLSMDGRGYIAAVHKLYMLEQPVDVDGQVYDMVVCKNAVQRYQDRVTGSNTGSVPPSCFFEPLTDRSQAAGIYVAGADNLWHHMVITKVGPEISVEITDLSYSATYYDCQPLGVGHLGLGAHDSNKHVHFDNVSFEVISPPDPESWDADLNGISDVCQDDDDDGIQNGVDNCPMDPDNDSDSDGVCGDVDNCPDVTNPDQGDSDGDGVGDACDSCPEDALKIEPGVCGCGTPDSDTDGDGALDCQDSCPNDPLKIDPGVCGCGVSDLDGDGDTVPDCLDGCPNDAGKTEPLVCGCGIADVDTDGDGTPDCVDPCPGDPLDGCLCVPNPAGQGYWHRQCLGVPASGGGIDPGRNGRGPQSPTEPNFNPDLMSCGFAGLEDAGLFGLTTCDGMDADPPSDPCERAKKQLTALVLNVCSDRLQEGCGVDVSAQACLSSNVGELIVEAAGLIETGFCNQAAACAAAVNEGDGLVDGGGRAVIESDREREGKPAPGRLRDRRR